jgi:DNA replication protein DnaC
MEEILNSIKSLRLPGMAQEWAMLQETRKLDTLSLCDGLRLLLQAEKDQRREHRNARLIREAHFRYRSSIEELSFDASRGLEQYAVLELASCRYIRNGIPVLITGAAGTGKSWLATALGHQACMMGHSVLYFNMSKLFEQINLARVQGIPHKFFEKLAKAELLILDDFGVKMLDGQQMLDFMEIMEDRHGRMASIIVSQLPVKSWYDIMKSNTTAADAILDRIVHSATRFELKGSSLRRKS